MMTFTWVVVLVQGIDFLFAHLAGEPLGLPLVLHKDRVAAMLSSLGCRQGVLPERSGTWE